MLGLIDPSVVMNSQIRHCCNGTIVAFLSHLEVSVEEALFLSLSLPMHSCTDGESKPTKKKLLLLRHQTLLEKLRFTSQSSYEVYLVMLNPVLWHHSDVSYICNTHILSVPIKCVPIKPCPYCHC